MRARMDRGCAQRAVPHGWTRAERISRPKAQAQDRTGPRQPGESPAAASARARAGGVCRGAGSCEHGHAAPRGAAHHRCVCPQNSKIEETHDTSRHMKVNVTGTDL